MDLLQTLATAAVQRAQQQKNALDKEKALEHIETVIRSRVITKILDIARDERFPWVFDKYGKIHSARGILRKYQDSDLESLKKKTIASLREKYDIPPPTGQARQREKEEIQVHSMSKSDLLGMLAGSTGISRLSREGLIKEVITMKRGRQQESEKSSRSPSKRPKSGSSSR